MILSYSIFRFCSATFFFNWHSHIIRTRHPCSVSNAMFWASRSTLRLIFLLQYSAFEEGHTNLPQSCLCQKHPLTNITALYFFSTISGHPGSFLTFFLYLNPFENRYFRTISSGFVFLLLICDIFMLRISFVWLSAILSPHFHWMSWTATVSYTHLTLPTKRIV